MDEREAIREVLIRFHLWRDLGITGEREAFVDAILEATRQGA